MIDIDNSISAYAFNNNDNLLLLFDIIDDKGDFIIDIETLNNIYTSLAKSLEESGYKGNILGCVDIFHGKIKNFNKDELIYLRDYIDKYLNVMEEK